MAERTIAQMFELRNPIPMEDKNLNLKQAGLQVIESKQLIGIEVELEKSDVKMRHKSVVWTAHADGSLRNTGLEWITHPISASDAPAALHDLFTGGANQCSFTPRTSIHVHFNCCDLMKDQVLNTVALYLHFERQLYNYVGKGRFKNIYCVPINETNLAAHLLSQRFDVMVGRWKKYTGLNLLPLASKGTIEFRHMHGTSNHDKISVWIRLLSRLFDYAVVNGKEVRQRLSTIWTVNDLDKLADEVFKDDWKYLTTRPSLLDAYAAKQCFCTGKDRTLVDLKTYQESPFALFGE